MKRPTCTLNPQNEATIKTFHSESKHSCPREFTRRDFLESTFQTSAAWFAADLFGRVKKPLNAVIEEESVSRSIPTKPLRSIVGNDKNISTVKAVQHIKRMRGGTQAHLFRCSDGRFYVVKFRNNPQDLKVLANEMLGTLLAARAGLPVPKVAVVDVAGWLIENNHSLRMELTTHTVPCASGLQFGSQYVVAPWDGQVFDCLPVSMLRRVRNLKSFAGILAFDKWTSNSDGRQAAFWRRLREQKYTASFIDQGYCFNGREWEFPDFASLGVYPDHEVYNDVCSWRSFQPWLSRIEYMSEESIWSAGGAVPPDWYMSDWHSLERLLDTLLRRRRKVRDLITAFRTSTQHPFPNWTRAS